MLMPALLFVLALGILLVSAHFFTRSAEGIGRWLKLSPFVIGVFIVGIGTSLPELVSARIANKTNAPKAKNAPGMTSDIFLRHARMSNNGNNIASGYSASGRTSVLSPKPGNQRKLVTGSVSMASAQSMRGRFARENTESTEGFILI